MYVYIYLSQHREKERQTDRQTDRQSVQPAYLVAATLDEGGQDFLHEGLHLPTLCMYISTYLNIERKRQTDRQTDRQSVQPAYLVAATLDEGGQDFLQEELHLLTPVLGPFDEELRQVVDHLPRPPPHLLLLLLLLKHHCTNVRREGER